MNPPMMRVPLASQLSRPMSFPDRVQFSTVLYCAPLDAAVPILIPVPVVVSLRKFETVHSVISELDELPRWMPPSGWTDPTCLGKMCNDSIVTPENSAEPAPTAHWIQNPGPE